MWTVIDYENQSIDLNPEHEAMRIVMDPELGNK